MDNSILDRIYSIIDVFVHTGKGKHNLVNHQIKTCPVTGLDISMQPKNSKFLSYTGVKWYYKNNFKIYKKILEPRLSENWKDKLLEDQFREIAHGIRNTDSNPRNNTRRAINRILKDQDTLFNNIKLIDKNKLKNAGLTHLLNNT
jgi:hypothetical protein